jgi:hypothetical protein
MDYEKEDKLGQCPMCRGDIYPVEPDYPNPAEEYMCEVCKLTWQRGDA